MLNNISRAWLLGGWFSALAVVIAGSAAMGANLATSGLLLVVGVVPAAVMSIIAAGAPPPTVAEILHSVQPRDGR